MAFFGVVIALTMAAQAYETATIILALTLIAGLLVAIGHPLPLLATIPLVVVGAFAIEFGSVPALQLKKWRAAVRHSGRAEGAIRYPYSAARR